MYFAKLVLFGGALTAYGGAAARFVGPVESASFGGYSKVVGSAVAPTGVQVVPFIEVKKPIATNAHWDVIAGRAVTPVCDSCSVGPGAFYPPFSYYGGNELTHYQETLGTASDSTQSTDSTTTIKETTTIQHTRTTVVTTHPTSDVSASSSCTSATSSTIESLSSSETYTSTITKSVVSVTAFSASTNTTDATQASPVPTSSSCTSSVVVVTATVSTFRSDVAGSLSPQITRAAAPETTGSSASESTSPPAPEIASSAVLESTSSAAPEMASAPVPEAVGSPTVSCFNPYGTLSLQPGQAFNGNMSTLMSVCVTAVQTLSSTSFMTVTQSVNRTTVGFLGTAIPQNMTQPFSNSTRTGNSTVAPMTTESTASTSTADAQFTNQTAPVTATGTSTCWDEPHSTFGSCSAPNATKTPLHSNASRTSEFRNGIGWTVLAVVCVIYFLGI
ncbi:hypothetical protein EJ06DRAFT_550277 [Trichodelitschia bisporula]|uniref:Uncharacterized protein n=1 Tax=Trichodelitschia bisporula TaxID=703511 RepID=A0A6G1HQX2_9PEZI|nr:hypothetical protein EJ06DRAFT_550277 [Trichodelitschia bisporula]